MKATLLVSALAVCSSPISAQTIAFDAHSTALVAQADFNQNGSSNGDLLPSCTCNGLIAGSSWFLGTPTPYTYDAWAVGPQQNADHYIAWTFHGGPRVVTGIQITSYYPANLAATIGPHYLAHFSLDYTLDAVPHWQTSNWQPLGSLVATPAGATTTGNQVQYGNTAVLPDVRVAFAPVPATAIRVHTYPLAGISNNGNFVVTEVSFATIVAGVATYGASTPGCRGNLRIGANGPPALGDAGFAVQCVNVVANGKGALLLGPAAQPAALPVLGIGVWIQLAGAITVAASANPFGTASLALPIPNDPALKGQHVFGQLVWADVCGPQGFTASDGLDLTIR